MRFVQDLVHHPRRLGVRRAIFQVHLWAGVALAVYLVVISLSGSVLVYKDALTRWTMPVGMGRYDAARTVAPEVVLRGLAEAEPGARVTNLQFPTEVFPAYLLTGDVGGRPARWVADPVSGRAVAAPRTWLDTVHDLHYYLLLPTAWGMQVNAAGAAVLLLLAATGLPLWWSGLRSWVRGLRVNLRANWRRMNYDLHSALGFWTLLIVVWWAVSGVYFGYYRQVVWAVSLVSPVRGMEAPKGVALPVVAAGAHASVGEIVRAASAVSPGGALWSVSLPVSGEEDSYVLLDRGAAGDFSHRDIVRVRAADPRVRSVWRYGELHTAADWFLWMMHPLHFGTVWGAGVRLLWCGLGVSLSVLTVSGVLMYWNRFLAKRLRMMRR